jgi:hypothetical protein
MNNFLLDDKKLCYIGFKKVYENDASRFYTRYDKTTINLILYSDGSWSVNHTNYFPETEHINEKVRQLVEEENEFLPIDENSPIDIKEQIPILGNSSMYIKNANIFKQLVIWIDECAQDDLEQFANDTNDTIITAKEEDSDFNKEYVYKTAIPYNTLHNSTRTLMIYVWGRRIRSTVPSNYKIDHNFNAAVLHGKKKGIDWRQDGRQEEIRIGVMKCSGFYDFMESMVRQIEAHSYKKIGINCAKGRHRSVTCAIILRDYFYPTSEIVYLELK